MVAVLVVAGFAVEFGDDGVIARAHATLVQHVGAAE